MLVPVPGPRGVVVVIPVKGLATAKTRLDVPADARREVALRLAEHAVGTALATPEVSRVLVVTADGTVKARMQALGAGLVHEVDPGLNAAARLGRDAARRVRPGDDVAIMVSDLPDLTTTDLSAAIAEFRARGPLVVTDVEGTGTTTLLQQGAADLSIGFGVGSAAHHVKAGFLPAEGALPGLRRDLDTTPLPAALGHLAVPMTASMGGPRR